MENTVLVYGALGDQGILEPRFFCSRTTNYETSVMTLTMDELVGFQSE